MIPRFRFKDDDPAAPPALDRKHRDHWTGKLGVRFLILSNESPKFIDESGALASRFVLLTLKEDFLGREDLDLKERLEPELPGILNWALEGLKRLRDRGRFKMPKSSEEMFRQLEELTSPITAFVRDCCKIGKEFEVETTKLYAKHKSWCEAQGYKPRAQAVFGKDLKAAYPKVRKKHSDGLYWYLGIELRDE
jgi:putative DNA primase/helicase